MGDIKSSVHIARLLSSEGFSDYVANQVERYWKASICHPRFLRRFGKLDKDIAEMCKKLTEAEKLILGKFIGLHKKMSFDTGLRIGLTAFAVKSENSNGSGIVQSPKDGKEKRALVKARQVKSPHSSSSGDQPHSPGDGVTQETPSKSDVCDDSGSDASGA